MLSTPRLRLKSSGVPAGTSGGSLETPSVGSRSPGDGSSTSGSCGCSRRPASEFDLDQIVPLSVLALEGFGGGSIDHLAKILGDDMVLLDDLGRRCCTRETARALFTTRAEKREAEIERNRLARENRAPNPIRERVRAIQDSQDGIEPTGDALSDIKTADTEKNWERAAAIRDEMNSGRMVYRRIRDDEQED